MAVDPIRTGNSITLTAPIEAESGLPYDLTGCALTATVTNHVGTTVLSSHTMTIDGTGTITAQTGLDLDSTAAAGVVTDTITGLETTALGVGWFVWRLYLIDTDANTYKVDERTFELRNVDLLVQWGGRSLAELRHDVADYLGDLLVLRASAEGDSSHFVDDFNINGAAISLNGRHLVVSTGPNAGHHARVTATDGSSNRITFTPAAPGAFEIGDEVELYNEHSRGWSMQQIDRAINGAIRDAYPLAKLHVSVELSPAFDMDTATITLPSEFTHIHEVGFADPLRGGYLPLRKGQWYGWFPQPNGQMTIRDMPAFFAHGRILRLVGYGKFPELRKDTDRTTLRAEYIIKTAVARLIESGINREDSRASLILKSAQDAERERTKIRTKDHADTVKVRT